MFRYLLLTVLLLTPACFMAETTINRPLNPEAISQLEVGTPAQQVADLLGAPEQVVELGEGSAWLYLHTSEKASGLFMLLVGLYGTDRQSDRCWVFFDKNGTLTHAGSTMQAKESEYHIPVF
jgi:outer membrane protein assembly factor BamE (lipoprotein component of BamABCDE complex)